MTWYSIRVATGRKQFDLADKWLTENFGQGKVIGQFDLEDMKNWSEDEGRWAVGLGRIFFRYKEDMLIFALRWTE